MRQRIRRIAPLQAAKVAGVLYGIMGLIFVPIMLVTSLAAPGELGLGMGFAIAMPFIYGIFGAIFTAIGAACYNVVAGWTGGLELDVEFDPAE